MKINTIEKDFNYSVLIINIILFITLLSISLLISSIYVSKENIFYFWDYANYYNKTLELVSIFKQSPQQAIEIVYQSLTNEYNKIPCLPLVPFILLFGNSRVSYIIACVIVYLIPFCLISGKIATRIIPISPQVVFWCTTFLALLLPTNWISVLRGYPDVGGAALIGVAILIYFKNSQLEIWWQSTAIGFFLLFSFIFRRHFAYSARALIIALFLQELIIFIYRLNQQFSVKTLKLWLNYNIKILLIAISSLIILLGLSKPLFNKLISINYRVLYRSYEQPLIFLWNYYGVGQGWLIWSLSILGFLIGIRSHAVSRSLAFFIAIFGGVSIIQWLLLSEQAGSHYYYHFNLFIILGIACLCGTAIIKLPPKTAFLILTTITLILLSNATLGLTNLGNFNHSIRSIFAHAEPPLVRNDRQSFIDLIGYLRELTPQQEAIYIGASSQTINSSLIIEAEKQIAQSQDRKLNILQTAEVDSRDFYPINELMQAEYIVIASPFQYHLHPQEQELIKFVFDSFKQPSELSKDFQKLPKQFWLDNDVIINIYKRIYPPSLKGILATLVAMKDYIEPEPSNNYNWAILSPYYSKIVSYDQQGNTNFEGFLSENAIRFLYFGKMPEPLTIKGVIDTQNCFDASNISLQLSSLDDLGNMTNTNQISYSVSDSKILQFSWPFTNQKAKYLLLQISLNKRVKDSGLCQAYLNNIKVEA